MNEIINKLAEYEKLFVNPSADNAENLNQLFSDSFMEAGSSGKIYNKEQTLNTLKSGDMPQTDLSEFSLLNLEGDTYLLRYKAARFAGGTTTLSYRSSIWQYKNGKWQILFHQGTKIE